MKKLSGVVIGCGAIAREHLAAVAGLDTAEIKAVCDLSAAKAEAAAERFGVPTWYTSYQQMLDDIRPDLVHITTPPSSHFPIASACLSKGLNVLCEKPITVDYEEFKQLRELAINHQCLLMENQNFRFHSGIQRIKNLLNAGEIGEVLDVQISLSLDILAPNSPYIDPNNAHSALSLNGGVIGDFLPHIAYLAHIFTGPVLDVRTIWIKRTSGSPLPFDEFRGLIRGELATAFVSFSANAQPDGFWVRVAGTRAQAETNLFEPPRFVVRRLRKGEPALSRLLDGLVEGRDAMVGSVAGFWRKLAGSSSYDGVPELISQTYHALENREPAPVALNEIDAVADLVDRLAAKRFML